MERRFRPGFDRSVKQEGTGLSRGHRGGSSDFGVIPLRRARWGLVRRSFVRTRQTHGDLEFSPGAGIRWPRVTGNARFGKAVQRLERGDHVCQGKIWRKWIDESAIIVAPHFCPGPNFIRLFYGRNLRRCVIRQIFISGSPFPA